MSLLAIGIAGGANTALSVVNGQLNAARPNSRCTGGSEREVRMKMNDWLRKGGMELATAPPTQVVAAEAVVSNGEMLQEWFDSMRPRWWKTTRDTNRQNFTKHVKGNKVFWTCRCRPSITRRRST